MLQFYSVNHPKFMQFGRVLSIPFSEKLDELVRELPVPEEGSSYQANIQAMEEDSILQYFSLQFGCMEVQVGCCWGRNDRLDALEWHKSSEINYAASDMILLLGDIRQIKNGFFDTEEIAAFYLRRGEAVELYQTTLHFCPIGPDGDIFYSVVVLPRGTNTPLDSVSSDRCLIAKNKWLICHPECMRQVERGRKVGLKGKNIIVKNFHTGDLIC